MAALASGALTLTLLPASGAAAADAPGSAWGSDAPKLASPEVKVGETKPVANRAETAPTGERADWRAEQKRRATGTDEPASARRAAAASDFVPEGQGAVPFHQISDFRITDSLVARVNHSTGNLMLAGTDFDVAGVGQQLQLTRTYNSLDAPWGKVSQRWWQAYERYAAISDDKVVIYDATGESLSFTKNSDGSFKTPKGYSKDLKKNADGTYTLTSRKGGSKDTYDAHGTLTKVTDRNKGEITITQHDEGAEHKGFKVTETRSGRWIDLVKTNASQWQAKDHTGRTVVFDLNSAGDLVKTSDTEGKATAFAYDSSRRLTKITTPEGRVTVFSYDSQNRVTSMLRATTFNGSGHTGPTYTYAYSNATPDSAGTTTVTDPEQHTTKYEHDADGKVTKTTDHLKRDRSKTFDANNNVATATDAMGTGSGGAGNVTTYGWDSRNNQTSAELPTGATATMGGYQTIAGSDLPGTMTTADGEESEYTYDAVGNTTSVAVTGTGGGTRNFTYNKSSPTCGGFEGQPCTLEDERKKKTSFSYDVKGNLTKVTPPNPLGETKYTYDELGRTKTATDGRGTTVEYTYDNRDRVKQAKTGSSTVTYHYDGDGNLRQRDDGTGTIKYEFDPLSRETVRTLQNGSQTRLAYTPAGNVETYTDPQGTVDYTWDEVNNLKELKDAEGRVTKYAYTRNDTRDTTTYPGGTVQKITLDESDRPTVIKTTSPKGTLVDLAYSYANGTKDGGKIRTSTDNVTGLKTTYTYDSAGRFSFAEEKKGATQTSAWQYCYDAAGNLTSQGITKGCPRGTTYDINDANQITAKNGSSTNWSYDKAGNETAGAPTETATRTGSQWNGFSQNTSLAVSGTTYAAQYGSTDQSERIKLGDTFFHNGPLGLSAKSQDGTDMGFNREPGGTLNSMTTGGKVYFYLTDALGSVVAMADESGAKVNTYKYSPRGVRVLAGTDEKVKQPHQFTGGYRDDTGLYHFAARYYDPNIGRFTSQDPSGQEKNPYLYAEGDPVNRIDPTGLASCPSWLSKACDAGGAVVDGVKSFASSETASRLTNMAVGCAAGATAAAESGAIAAGSMLGPGGGAGVGVLGCATGAVVHDAGGAVITY
ncbi:RHS repeat-associated core domain-containing protein [Streptomyces albidoflavus]|uniref:RHS repeat-associated core domain-containing protein n=1 Tax=Streptomyces albidoflavus TaxID=1886 RepID=UPI001F5DC895|nr:RHS repeat-associated core domain-containing protein [Streptomyces albidoflavus]